MSIGNLLTIKYTKPCRGYLLYRDYLKRVSHVEDISEIGIPTQWTWVRTSRSVIAVINMLNADMFAPESLSLPSPSPSIVFLSITRTRHIEFDCCVKIPNVLNRCPPT